NGDRMTVRVAIMGFGRIGRNIFRALYPRNDLEVVAINDIASPQAMEYLLRYDSLHGRFEEPVRIMDGYLYAKGKRIPILHYREPGEIPWYDYGTDVVVEATGRFRAREELQKHLDMGADRVILSTPPVDEIDVVYIHGVSKGRVGREHRIISCGSSTANCTMVMLKVLDDAFGVETGFFTSVHAYTAEQSLIDVPSSIDLRLSRAAVENIVPLHSWTRKGVERFFPKLKGRFGGYKLNVPVPDVSCVDLVTVLPQEVTVPEVTEVFRSAAGSHLKQVLSFAEEPIVSSDMLGSSASCTFDSLTTMVVSGNMLKTLGWYDQGGGLSHRIVDVIAQLAPPRLQVGSS
ncbi:MAG: type I glyceraldehyde-3-phosphate dehydrogenase, partial [Planctomycetota bacterium]